MYSPKYTIKYTQLIKVINDAHAKEGIGMEIKLVYDTSPRLVKPEWSITPRFNFK